MDKTHVLLTNANTAELDMSEDKIDLSVEGRVDIVTEVIAQSNELLVGDFVIVIYGRQQGDGAFDICMSALDIDPRDVKSAIEFSLRQCSTDIYPIKSDVITNEKPEPPVSAKVYSLVKDKP